MLAICRKSDRAVLMIVMDEASAEGHLTEDCVLRPVPENAIGMKLSWDGSEGPVEISLDFYWHQLRIRRNQLLNESDKFMFSDHPNFRDESVLIYRTALRNLPDNTEDPRNVIWPDKPEILA